MVIRSYSYFINLKYRTHFQLQAHPTSLPTYAVETVVRVPATASISYLNATAMRFNARVEHGLAFGVVIERAIFRIRGREVSARFIQGISGFRTSHPQFANSSPSLFYYVPTMNIKLQSELPNPSIFTPSKSDTETNER